MGDDTGRGGNTDSVGGSVTEQIHVLLVDDQPDVAEITALHLERRRDTFELTVTTSGEAALEALETDVIDCIVSDYDMPNITGLDLLREVNDRDIDAPFILYTGKGSEEIASKAISAGVTDYLQKQGTTDQYDVLANRIENAVARRRSEQARAETELRYRNLVETSPHAIFVHRDGTILYANERLRKLAGFDDISEVYQANPLDYVHPADRETIKRRMEEIGTSRDEVGWLDWRFQPDVGEIRHVESRGSVVSYAGESAVQVVLRDVTEQRRHEQRLEALNDATRDLLLAESKTAVASRAITVVEEVLDEPLANIWEYDADTETLVPLSFSEASKRLVSEEAGIDLDENPDVDFTEKLTFPSDTIEMTVFHEGEARVVTNYAEHPDGVTEAIETSFLFPLSDHGLLGIASVEPTSFDGWDRQLLDILGRSVIAALDRLAE